VGENTASFNRARSVPPTAPVITANTVLVAAFARIPKPGLTGGIQTPYADSSTTANPDADHTIFDSDSKFGSTGGIVVNPNSTITRFPPAADNNVNIAAIGYAKSVKQSTIFSFAIQLCCRLCVLYFEVQHPTPSDGN